MNDPKIQRLRDRFLTLMGHNYQWSQLFDLLPDVSFFVKDRQGRFMALNRKGCEYCGVATEATAIGMTDHDFFPKQRADSYVTDDHVCMDSGASIHNRLESAPEREGSPRLVVTSKMPIRDKQDGVIGVAGFSRQIDQLQQSSGSVERFARVANFLHREYGTSITTTQLAKMAALSVSQFERRFRRAFGVSPRQYLIRIRVEAACRLLADTEQTVSAVAHATGFHDHAHLSRSFRRVMNVTPTEYRKQHRTFPSV
jgi:PAS domain S-box-containing protein